MPVAGAKSLQVLRPELRPSNVGPRCSPKVFAILGLLSRRPRQRHYRCYGGATGSRSGVMLVCRSLWQPYSLTLRLPAPRRISAPPREPEPIMAERPGVEPGDPEGPTD